ncbi:MAG: Fic family protein [Ignavibacteriaceae bacterium]|jgi:Fic family protein|nr:Fic family protein [Ignavibacteriaceae bacterium]
MKIEDFKAGKYQQEYKYKSFIPGKINHEWVWNNAKINSLLSEASLSLGSLNAFSLYVPDVNIFIRMHIVKEATNSSRIEGTRTELEEALLKDDDIQPEKRDDWQEVQNYIQAMNHLISKLKTLPVSTRILKESHKILMQGVRGESKTPGEFRTSQNWIGGATINDAVFIPPPHTLVNELMSDLEKFLHNENINVPQLIKAAIAHYQFETIHPFLDGNGRIGRLLITLQLVGSGVLSKPTLYLSDYFEKHRTIYYDNLNIVRIKNDMAQWIKFFLVAVIETSKRGSETFQRILELKDRIENEKIVNLGKKLPKAKDLMNKLYSNPIINSNDVKEFLKITPATANSLIQDFINLGILKEITGGKRYRLFSFEEYLKLFTKNNL